MHFLKTFLSTILLLVITSSIFGQVGINTENPVVTLDVVASSLTSATAEGFLPPRLTSAELVSKNSAYGTSHNGAIVYITNVDAPSTTAKTALVSRTGYYYYDATATNTDGANLGLWIPLKDKRKQFYMPSVVLPTNSTKLPESINYQYENETFTVNLFNLYLSQYSNPPIKSSSSTSLNFGSSASDFDYFVLYYDTSVFGSVTISSTGNLSYKVISNAPISEKTFMNIVFRER